MPPVCEEAESHASYVPSAFTISVVAALELQSHVVCWSFWVGAIMTETPGSIPRRSVQTSVPRLPSLSLCSVVRSRSNPYTIAGPWLGFGAACRIAEN